MQKKKTEEFPTPTNLTESINLCMLAGKKAKILNDALLSMMYAYSETHKQSNDANSPQEYVTREAKISCSCGGHPILLDAEKDYGVIAVNGKPILTCRDCKVNINISSFGVCYAEVEGYKGAPRSINDIVGEINDKHVYRCMPIIDNVWKQKWSNLLIGDAESRDFAEALKVGAHAICRYGGIIEVVEVPEAIEVSETPEEILPLESKWLEEKTKDMEMELLVDLDFMKKMGWVKIADYYVKKNTDEKSDWEEVYKSDDNIFFPDPEIERHFRDIDEQDITNINRVLNYFNITNKNRICAFLSQIDCECKRGMIMCEQVGDSDSKPENTTRTAMREWHMKKKSYPYQYRGGGAIQLTHKENYEKVKEEIDDEKIVSIGTEYVAYNYPWLSAGLFWDIKKLNNTLEKTEGKDKEKGILGVINIINPRTTKAQQRAKVYEKYLASYSKPENQTKKEAADE